MSTADLRQPFPANTIKVKPQSVTADKTKGLVTFYVDARIVAERLNEVVGSEGWTDEYKVLAPVSEGAPVECRLTLNGVTKADVGQVKPGDLDDKTWKSSYSDAFKRAAVKFGVGAYLYESPDVWVETKVGNDGKVRGFSDNGKAQALVAYAKWIGDSSPGTGATKSEDSAGGRTGGFVTSSGNGAAGKDGYPPPAAPQNIGWTFASGKHAGKTLETIETEGDRAYIEWYAASGPKEEVREICNAFLLGGELAAVGATEVNSGGSFYDESDIDGDSIPF